MPWYAYSSLTSEHADAIVYYLKDVLPAVQNEIPAASLNEGFEVMAIDVSQQPQETTGAFSFTSPYVLGAIGLIIMLAAFLLFRRKQANSWYCMQQLRRLLKEKYLNIQAKHVIAACRYRTFFIGIDPPATYKSDHQ